MKRKLTVPFGEILGIEPLRALNSPVTSVDAVLYVVGSYHGVSSTFLADSVIERAN